MQVLPEKSCLRFSQNVSLFPDNLNHLPTKIKTEITCHHCACFIPEKRKITSLFSKNIKMTSTKLKIPNDADLLFRKSGLNNNHPNLPFSFQVSLTRYLISK